MHRWMYGYSWRMDGCMTTTGEWTGMWPHSMVGQWSGREWTGVEIWKAYTFYLYWTDIKVGNASICVPIERVSQMWKTCTCIFMTSFASSPYISVCLIVVLFIVCNSFGRFAFVHLPPPPPNSLLRDDRHGEEGCLGVNRSFPLSSLTCPLIVRCMSSSSAEKLLSSHSRCIR